MFLAYVQALCLHFNVTTVNKQACDWTTIIEDQIRQSHITFPLRGPGPPTYIKQKAHRDGQGDQYQAILYGLSGMPRIDAISSLYP